MEYKLKYMNAVLAILDGWCSLEEDEVNVEILSDSEFNTQCAFDLMHKGTAM